MENFKRIDSHWINPESPWNMIRGKYLFENPKILNKDSKENNLLSLTLNGVLNKDMESGGGLRPDSYETYQIFYKNDLVFKLIDLENVKTSRVGWVHERGLMSPVYIRLKSKDEKINTRYFYYYFFDLYQRHIFNSIGSGIRSSLSGTNLLELLVPNPSHEEQNKIVSFLDKKTTQIDKLIKKIEQKIELLKEQRISLINEVVTKGLNPNVEMKDSGIEWIGEIPNHWETKKLKYLSKIIYGISPPDTTYNDEGIGTILINGPVEYSETDFGLTRSLKWTTEPKKVTTKGSLLFCLRGSTTGRMNITHTDVSIGRGVCSLNSLENQWYLIYSMFSVRKWIQDQIGGSTFPSVTSDDVNNYKICSPPTQEQQQIVEYLDEQTQKIDETISKEERRIELLKEYKQSLISEVVTGKKRVV